MNTTSGGNRGGKRPQAGGRVFSLEGGEAEDLTATVSGTLLIKHLVFKNCTIQLEGTVLPVDLVQLDIQG